MSMVKLGHTENIGAQVPPQPWKNEKENEKKHHSTI